MIENKVATVNKEEGRKRKRKEEEKGLELRISCSGSMRLGRQEGARISCLCFIKLAGKLKETFLPEAA
jgi:hypothetical protein